MNIKLFTIVVFAVTHPVLTHAQSESPDYTFEVQAGSYMPNIDSQFESSQGSVRPPYEEAFGGDPSLVLRLKLQRNLAAPFGTIGLGSSIGYWCKEGKAIAPTGSDASDTTEMVIYPIQLEASYRLDRWVEYFPLVPMVRGGLSYYYWRIFDGADDLASFSTGQDAQGGTLGWHVALGVHILLDAFDQEAAIDFERDAGLVNTYFTIEYQMSRVDDFGSAESFRLGDDVLLFGLALDY
ncbi:MAG: MXAN_2562 family outer membrane beta-barrel protein [Bradymonadia bacterium]